MDKTEYFLEVFWISGVIGVISRFLGTVETSYAILLVLLIIDTITGVSVAVKQRRFNSKGLSRLINKIATYTAAVITVRLLEIGILPLLETMLLSQTIIAFLQVIEAVSILENLTLLGVPLPRKLIHILLKHLKIPGLEQALKINKDHEKDIKQIEELIKLHVKSIQDAHIKKLLEIKFEVLKNMAYEINIIYNEQENNNELIFYKTMFLVELTFEEMRERWKEEKIPRDYINYCNEVCQPKVDRWLQKIYDICYSELSIDQKKDQLIDNLIIMLYQTLFTVQKGI
jgi:toxin secretion/phage lysis holin